MYLSDTWLHDVLHVALKFYKRQTQLQRAIFFVIKSDMTTECIMCVWDMCKYQCLKWRTQTMVSALLYRFWDTRYDIDPTISAAIRGNIADMTVAADIDDISTKNHWTIQILMLRF